MGSIQSPVGKFVRTLQAVADAKPQTGDAIAPAAAQESPEAVQETEAPAEAEAPAAE